jgi:hypothetical protein
MLEPLPDEYPPLLYKWNTYSEVPYRREGDDAATNDKDDVDYIRKNVTDRTLVPEHCRRRTDRGAAGFPAVPFYA